MKTTFISILIGISLSTMALPTVSFAQAISGYCVLWLRTDRGINIHGDAWNIKPNIPLAGIDIGDVVLLKEGRGHVAEITGFKGTMPYQDGTMPTTMTVIENWNGRVRTRDIPLLDSRVRGFYRGYPQL